MPTPSRFPHHRLDAWQVCVDLVAGVQRLIPTLRRGAGAERDQLRRSAPAIARNLAEGASRISPRDKIHHFNIARAECAETDASLEMAAACGFADPERVDRLRRLADRVGAMLTGLVAAQQRRLE